MAFCAPADLITGDMPVSEPRAQAAIDMAYDEIAVALAPVYSWPLSPLGDHALTILKRINQLIATGRLVMAQAVPSEDNSTQAYGTYMLREGQELLRQVAMQEVLLPGVTPSVATAGAGNGPAIINLDGASAMEHFYEWANPLIPVAGQWGAHQ